MLMFYEGKSHNTFGCIPLMIFVHYVLNILLQVASLLSSVLNNKRLLVKYSGARNLNDENSVFVYLGTQ